MGASGNDVGLASAGFGAETPAGIAGAWVAWCAGIELCVGASAAGIELDGVRLGTGARSTTGGTGGSSAMECSAAVAPVTVESRDIVAESKWSWLGTGAWAWLARSWLGAEELASAMNLRGSAAMALSASG